MKSLKTSLMKWMLLFIACSAQTTKSEMVLDETFGKKGSLEFIPDTGPIAPIKTVTALAIQPYDHKIIILGTVIAGPSYLSRYHEDGLLDTTFGVNGTVTCPDYFGIITLQLHDHKIIVSDNHKVFARYNEDGSLDTTFGRNGVAPTLNKSRSIALQPHNNKIIALGSALHQTPTPEMTLACFNPDGSPDTAFGTDGTGIMKTSYPTLYSIGIQPHSHKIVVAGQTKERSFLLACYNSDGSVDTSFGPNHDGVALTKNIVGFVHHDTSIIIQPHDSKIIVTGTITTGDNSRFFIARYNENGTPDTAFSPNHSGVIYTHFSSNSHSVALSNDHKIIVGGREFERGMLLLASYNPDGSPDTTFGPDGVNVITNTLPGNALNALSLQPQFSQKIIIASSITLGVEFLTRYKLVSPTEILIQREIAALAEAQEIERITQIMAAQEIERITQEVAVQLTREIAEDVLFEREIEKLSEL